MKTLKFMSIILILLLVACKSETKKDTNKTITTQPIDEVITKSQQKSNSTYLCKINGKDWAYTKASGIVSRHKKTKKRTAIITFTKQLNKGKEIIQLYYDGDTNQLEQVNIHLKVSKNDGKTMTAMYIYHPNTSKFHPKAKVSGAIDLSNPTNASGNAEVSDLDVRFDKNLLVNANDKLINVEGLNFTGIGYSDTDNLFK